MVFSSCAPNPALDGAYGKKYSWKTTGEEVCSDFTSRAKGKVVLVTGANTGLGFETARCLLLADATVVITARSVEKVEETIERLKKLVPAGNIDGIAMELASLKSVKECAEAYIKSGRKLDILINNAGIMACPK